MTALQRAADLVAVPAAPREAYEKKKKRVKPHQAPSTVMPGLRAEIVGSLRAGRSLVQTAKEYDVSYVVALELWMRDVEKRLLAIARPAVVTAAVLMGVGVADVWRWDGGAVAVHRVFRRGGRARKRGLEDGSVLVELRVSVASGGVDSPRRRGDAEEARREVEDETQSQTT